MSKLFFSFIYSFFFLSQVNMKDYNIQRFEKKRDCILCIRRIENLHKNWIQHALTINCKSSFDNKFLFLYIWFFRVHTREIKQEKKSSESEYLNQFIVENREFNKHNIIHYSDLTRNCNEVAVAYVEAYTVNQNSSYNENATLEEIWFSGKFAHRKKSKVST